MRTRVAVVVALSILLLVPADGESASGGGRFGVGYSSYPIAGGFGGGGDLFTLRFSAYQFFFEGGFRLDDRGDSKLAFGSKLAFRPMEYHGVPVELGGSLAFVTDGTENDKGEAATLIHLGFFGGLSTLVTDEVSVGVALYPLSFSLGGAETLTDMFLPAFNIHFLF